MNKSDLRFETAQDIINNLHTHFIVNNMPQARAEGGVACVSFRSDQPERRCAVALQATTAYWQDQVGGHKNQCGMNPPELMRAVNATHADFNVHHVYVKNRTFAETLQMIHDSAADGVYHFFTDDNGHITYSDTPAPGGLFKPSYDASMRSFCEIAGLVWPS